MVASDLAAKAEQVVPVVGQVGSVALAAQAAKAAKVALVSDRRRKCFQDRMWCLSGQSKTGGLH